jgi:lysophospholipase L1-like esterase
MTTMNGTQFTTSRIRPAGATARQDRVPTGHHAMRVLGMVVLTAILAVLAGTAHPRAAAQSSRHPLATASRVGPKAYYLALGDSIVFGYQQNGDWTHGYPELFFADLHPLGTRHLINMGCGGEGVTTFINGGCPALRLFPPKYPYDPYKTQLAAAVAFLRHHPGQVSPVTIDLGANDFFTGCSVNLHAAQLLVAYDAKFSRILAELRAALVGGDLFTMNLFDPGQNICAGHPEQLAFAKTINAHIARDAAHYGVPVADMFKAFGNDTTPNPLLCAYTWVCNTPVPDFHPRTLGYALIASTFAQLGGAKYQWHRPPSASPR